MTMWIFALEKGLPKYFDYEPLHYAAKFRQTKGCSFLQISLHRNTYIINLIILIKVFSISQYVNYGGFIKY
jgi:hypothetical protein